MINATEENENGESTSSPPPLVVIPVQSTAALGQAREEAQGREMATAAWFSTQHVLSWSTRSSPLGSSLYPPATAKAHHRDRLFQSITLQRVKLTSFYCLSAFGGFLALCNKHFSKENYLPNSQKEFYSPLRSAESQQTL